MPGVRHSIIISGSKLEDELNSVNELLSGNKKVIWIGNKDDCTFLDTNFHYFKDIHMLQTFIANSSLKFTIIDGKICDNDEKIISYLREIKDFNLDQYLVEHSDGKNIMVVASAGTGKTSVMIDRLMYLIDVESVKLSDVTMVTFTNSATEHMYSRLLKKLSERYDVTKAKKDFERLEELSQINISTIDSFSYGMLKTIGDVHGFGNNTSIASFTYDVKNIILKLIDDYYESGTSVKKQLGLNLMEASNLIYNYYRKIQMLGISSDDLQNIDWGESHHDSLKVHDLIRYVLPKIDRELLKIKLIRDSVSLDDLSRELNSALKTENKSNIPNLKYLFVDEFQDTDNDQIELFTNLIREYGISSFIVGDPKQSIYRFRGADDSAFDLFKSIMLGHGLSLSEYELINNYRTDKYVLGTLEKIFHNWSKKSLLSNFDSLYSCKGDIGGDISIRKVSASNRDKILVLDIKNALMDLNKRISEGKASKNDTVTILVRSNKQLNEVAKLCDLNNIPLITKRDNPFYTSDAVRDFYSMISSYVYQDNPTCIINYLNSPYSSMNQTMDLTSLVNANGNRTILCDELFEYMDNTTWDTYNHQFKIKPALSVIHDMVENTRVAENYIAKLKSKGIVDADVLTIKANRYVANLDKLLTILYTLKETEHLSLYNILDFLKIQIATNRDELEKDVEFETEWAIAQCMTVHKAKGLEFDTVIVPFNKSISNNKQSELLISRDKNTIAWKYVSDIRDYELENSNYSDVNKEEYERITSEETRILYVALTRAIRNLTIYTYKTTNEYSWSKIIKEAIG